MTDLRISFSAELKAHPGKLYLQKKNGSFELQKQACFEQTGNVKIPEHCFLMPMETKIWICMW